MTALLGATDLDRRGATPDEIAPSRFRITLAIRPSEI